MNTRTSLPNSSANKNYPQNWLVVEYVVYLSGGGTTDLSSAGPMCAIWLNVVVNGADITFDRRISALPAPKQSDRRNHTFIIQRHERDSIWLLSPYPLSTSLESHGKKQRESEIRVNTTEIYYWRKSMVEKLKKIVTAQELWAREVTTQNK